MGLWNDIDWYPTPKKKDFDPDHDGYIEFEFDGKCFRSERALQTYLREEEIKNYISAGLTIPEIRNRLHNPKWNPTKEQIDLMKLAKEAKVAMLKRLGFDDDAHEENKDSILMPEDEEAFARLLRKKGTYSVKMDDGFYYKINSFGNGRTYSCGGIVPEADINGTKCTTTSRKTKRRKEDETDIPVSDEVQCADRKTAEQKTRCHKEKAVIVPRDSLICIDGSNVIGLDSELRTKILQSIVTALDKAGYQHKTFVDKTIFSWLKNRMHDEDGAEYLVRGERNGVVIVAPNKTEADGQILQLAEFEKNVHIITNDQYRDYDEMHPWLTDRKAKNRLHGINLVPIGDDVVRVLIAGFNLNIIVDRPAQK